jgi:hypothetical protein
MVMEAKLVLTFDLNSKELEILRAALYLYKKKLEKNYEVDEVSPSTLQLLEKLIEKI